MLTTKTKITDRDIERLKNNGPIEYTDYTTGVTVVLEYLKDELPLNRHYWKYNSKE